MKIRLYFKIVCIIIMLTILPGYSAAKNVLTQYKNTNQLVVDKHFEQQLKYFFDHRLGDYYWPHGSISEQSFEGLHGPPDEIQKINNMYFASACRAHSCQEKASVLFIPPDRIMAVALIHYHVHIDPNDDEYAMDDSPSLTIFYKDKQKPNEAVLKYIVTWAKDVTKTKLKNIEQVSL